MASNTSNCAPTGSCTAVRVSGPHITATLAVLSLNRCPRHVNFSGDTSCQVQTDASFDGGLRDSFVGQIVIDPTTVFGKIELLVGNIETLRDRGRLGPGDFTSLAASLERALAALDSQDSTGARQALSRFIQDMQQMADRGSLTIAEAGPIVSAAMALVPQI